MILGNSKASSSECKKTEFFDATSRLFPKYGSSVDGFPLQVQLFEVPSARSLPPNNPNTPALPCRLCQCANRSPTHPKAMSATTAGFLGFRGANPILQQLNVGFIRLKLKVTKVLAPWSHRRFRLWTHYYTLQA